MDLDLLHIKLTAYSLGELELAQKADIERILTESQDARDQVARAKNIAKAIKDLLPQSSEDIQPMTPGEYRARFHAPASASAPSFVPDPLDHGQAAQPFAQAPAQPAAPVQASNALVWLLALGCLVLAIGWLVHWKNSGPAPTQKLVLASDWEAKDALAKTLSDELQKTKDALDKESGARSEIESRNAALEKAKAELAGSVEALESEQATLEEHASRLESALTRAHAAAAAVHSPFTPTQAQLVATLPPTGTNDTLAHVTDALKDGEWPLPDLVDAGELVQSFTYNYPAPPPGQKLPTLGSALTVCPWNEKHLLARVTLTAGAEAANLASLQVEFNPAKVAAWRLIGREAKGDHPAFGDASLPGDILLAGGQGTGELNPGTSLTLLYEIDPTRDPMAPLLAKRVELGQKLEDAKRAVTAAKDQASLTEAKLAADGLRLDLADLDEQISKSPGSQKPAWRYLAPPQPTAAAAQGDWLAVTASVGPAGGAPSAVESALRGAATPFPEADADFRLAASAAAFGMVLRGSPQRGQADLKLIEALIKDLPATHDGAKALVPLVEEARKVAGEETPS